MTDNVKKTSELATTNTASGSDRIVFLKDPAGVPSTRTITVNNFTNSIRYANTTVSGTIKVGNNLSINTTGYLNATGGVPEIVLPNIAYTGVFGGLPALWRYTAVTPKLQYSSNGSFRTTGDGIYWLDQNFDDQDYDLSGLTSISFTNIGGIKGYLDFSDKSEVVMTTLDLGDIAVVDEWVRFGGFSNTLTTFAANNLVDVGSYFEIYGNQLVNGSTWHFNSLDRVSDSFYIDYNWSGPFSNTAAPTFSALRYVGNGMYIYYNRYTTWSDFTSLEYIRNDLQFYQNTNNDDALFAGPGFPALAHIQYGSLRYYQNDGMQSVPEFTALDRIDGDMQFYQNSQLESFPSFPLLIYCASINSSGCGSMTTYDGDSFLPSILTIDGDVNFQNCAFSQESIDNILVKLASLDGNNGTTIFQYRNIYLDQGTNAVPSQTGLDAIAVLQSRNCNVAVNS